MKLFIVKLLVLLVIICLSQVIVAHYYPYSPPESVTELVRYQKLGLKIIFFGDSSVTWHSQKETNVITTAGMLTEVLGRADNPVGQVAHDAYDAYAFDMYTKYMTEQGYYPDYIVIPINLRAFSPSWDIHPNFQFPEEAVYLKLYRVPVLRNFMSFIVNMYVPDVKRIYQTMYSLSKQYDGDTVVGTGELYERKIRESNPNSVRHPTMMQMYYLGPLKSDNRQLTALLRIAERFKNTKTKLIFYITPIDYQTGELLFGPRFSAQVKQNITVLMTRLSAYPASVLDLSFTQPTKNFTWDEVWYINEHLNQTGRLFIAQMLAERIK